MSENYQRLGNFVLLEKLNAGGMAEVYLGKSIGANGVNKFFAIKRILPQYADNREFIDMFKDEAKIAVNLDHGNVVSIIDFKADKNQLYLVMDYVQGQNLRQLLQQKKKKNLELNLPFIVYIIREVASGLEHAHKSVDKTTNKALNIIHRDMSPQNIMISYEGEIKIVDFGIAKTENAADSTKVGTLKGKFSYMSPEQAEGQEIDQTTDLFSLGIILWELIADDRLFIANNEVNILKRIKECDIPDIRRVVPTIPPELEKIVKKSLLKDRATRYQTAGELIKDLTRFLNKEYPDFTRTDFATFVKFLFEEEHKAVQNQLVKYSKIQMESLPNPQQQAQYESALKNTFSIANESPPKGFSVDHGSQAAFKAKPLIDTNFHKGEMKKPAAAPAFQKPNSILQPTPPQSPPPPPPLNPIQHPAPGLMSAPKINTNVTKSYTAQKTGTNAGANQIRYRTKSKSTFDAKFLSSFIVLIGVGFGAFYYKTKMARDLGGSPQATNLPSASPHGKKGSAAKFLMYIQSTPGKARIYLNGKDTGLVTPANVEVEGNSNFNLTLSADGFLPFTSRYTASQNGQKISATLVQVAIGYVNISVANGGIDTVIFVNGLRLQEKAPITRHPIPADTPVKIRAEHSFSQTSAETVVKVGKDEKKDVDLVLTTNTTPAPEQQNNENEPKQ